GTQNTQENRRDDGNVASRTGPGRPLLHLALHGAAGQMGRLGPGFEDRLSAKTDSGAPALHSFSPWGARVRGPDTDRRLPQAIRAMVCCPQSEAASSQATPTS